MSETFIKADIDNIVELEKIHSTNDFLRSLLEHPAPLPNGLVVSTRYQTAGRGQVGNTWHSEEGKNLLCSFLFYADFIEIKDQFYLSKIVSLSILKVLLFLLPDHKCDFAIKWPNDIYCGDKKLAGILIENSLMGSKIQNTIVGLGLNIDQEVFPAELPNPISLKNIDVSKAYSKREIIKMIRMNVLSYFDQYKSPLWRERINAEYLNLLYRFNINANFSDENGLFEAKIVNVQEDGRLILSLKNGDKKSYYFKEVEYKI